MRLNRKQKIVLAASGTAIAALGGTAWWILRPRRKGMLVCPASRLADADDLRIGSYVVLELTSADRSFSEPTWGRILSRRILGNLKVLIVGEINDQGSPIDLATERHGYAIGQTIAVDPKCVWDVYRPPSGAAELVCGPALAGLSGDSGIATVPDPDASRLRRDDDAAVIIASDGKPTELIWLRVESSSPGAQSFTGRVLQPTVHADVHGIRQHDKLEFVRDCVVDVRISGEL